jgi:hypothetical protein
MDAPMERRRGERRKSSWLYWTVAALFALYLLSSFVPVLYLPKIVRVGMMVVTVLLCVFDRRGVTLKHLGLVVLVGVLGAGSFAYMSRGTHEGTLWIVVTAFLLMLAIVVFNVKMEPRSGSRTL